MSIINFRNSNALNIIGKTLQNKLSCQNVDDIVEIANNIKREIETIDTSKVLMQTMNIIAKVNSAIISVKTTKDTTDKDAKSQNKDNKTENTKEVIQNTKNEVVNKDTIIPINDMGINGTIDNPVYQGKSGDCGLVSAILALNATSAGKQAIRNAITVNSPTDEYPNGSVTVSFKGAGVSYTFSAEEIQEHDPDNGKEKYYSRGDNDALILELATEKLRLDIKSGKVKVPQRYSSVRTHGNDNLYAVNPADFVYFLTGKERTANKLNFDLSDLSYNDISQILTNASSSRSVVSFTAMGDKRNTVLGCNIPSGHAYAITNIDTSKKTVSFINPWNSTKTYTMTWDEFTKIGITQLQRIDL